MAIRGSTLLLIPALLLALGTPALAQSAGHETHGATKASAPPAAPQAAPAPAAKGCPKCEKMKAETAKAPAAASYLEDVPMERAVTPPAPALRRNPH